MFPARSVSSDPTHSPLYPSMLPQMILPPLSSYPLQTLRLGSLSSSYLFVVHFISLSYSSAVSLFPARAKCPPPRPAPKQPVSKIWSFWLNRTGLLRAKVLLIEANRPPRVLHLRTAARKRSPTISPVTLDSVDADKEGCDRRGACPFLPNQISSLFEAKTKKSWSRGVLQSTINGSWPSWEQDKQWQRCWAAVSAETSQSLKMESHCVLAQTIEKAEKKMIQDN